MATPQGIGGAPGPLIVDVSAQEATNDRDFVLECVERADPKKQKFVPIWDEVLENFFMTSPRGRDVDPNFGSSRSQFGWLASEQGVQAQGAMLRDPETHQVIENLSIQTTRLVLGPSRYMTARPVGIESPEKAEQLTNVLLAVNSAPGRYRTYLELIKEGFLLGTGVAEIPFEIRSRQQLVRVPKLTSGFVTGFTDEPREVVYRRGPGLRIVDLYDIWVDPHGTRLNDDMLYIVKRFQTTEQQARELVRRGTYDREATERAISIAKGRKGGRLPKDDTTKRFEQFSQVARYGGMTGFECWAETPHKHRDGARNRVITLLEGEVVRSHINPYLDGMFPFVDFVTNPVMGRWYGMSPGEVVRFLQDATNHFLMAMTDAANMAIRSPLLVGHAFQGDLDRLQNRGPLDNIVCANPDAVKPLQTDLNTLQYAGLHYLQRITRIREATGAVPGGVQPIQPQGEQTATQFRGVAELASERVVFMANLLERDAFPRVARMFHSRLRQFMPEQGMIAQLGSEQFVFRPEDIDFDAEFEFTGSTTGRSAAQTLQTTTAALTALMANPDALLVAPELVIRQIRDGLQINDAEALVMLAQQRLSELRAAGGEADARGSPPAPRGVPTGGPL
jgi:hypothetical protein